MTLDSFDSQMMGAENRKREKAEKNVVNPLQKWSIWLKLFIYVNRKYP